MLNFETSHRIENKSKSREHEKREEYLNLTEGYFMGSKKFDTLAEEIENAIETTVTDDKSIMSQINEPVIFVSNHPRLDQSLSISADKIQNAKGGNTFGFDRFNYPLVRQLMLRDLLERPFLTVSLDNGWREAMEECWHIIITRGGNDRFNEIVKQYKPGNSIVIYPEGKSTGEARVLPFRSGFFHVAQALDFKKVVIGVSSPILSLSGKNSMAIIDYVEIPPSSSNMKPQDFIDNIQEKISSALNNIYE